MGVTLVLADYAEELNLTVGQVYQFDMFHAERQTSESNFAMTTTLAETCNVITSNFRTNGADVELAVDWTANGNTSNSDWEVVAGPGWGYFEPPKTMVLMAPNVPNAVGYMFYKSNQVNVGSGFSFKFEFQMTGGAGNGFAVLFHNRELGLLNFNGGTGPNLGIKNNDNSFAVVFDVTNPNRQELGVHYNVHGDRRNSMSNATKTVYDPDVIQNWKDGTWHSVEVMYYETPDWLEVYLDNSLRLRERNFSMINVIGGRNAHIGFSASSGDDTQYLTTKIRNVELTAVKVLPRNSVAKTTIVPIGGFPLLADGRATVGFQFFTKDACLNAVQYGGLSGLVQSRMVGFVPIINDNDTDVGNRRLLRNLEEYEVLQAVEEFGTVTDLQNGAYQVDFSTTTVAVFTVYLAFGTNCTWNGVQYEGNSNDECWQVEYFQGIASTPYVTQSPTMFVPEPTPPGWGLTVIIVSAVVGGIVICCALVFILFGVRIRNRWRKDREFVETGKLVVLDRDLELHGYQTMDTLQRRMQKTVEALQAERAKSQLGQDHIIRDLLQQRSDLERIIHKLELRKSGLDPDASNAGFLKPARGTQTNRATYLAPFHIATWATEEKEEEETVFTAIRRQSRRLSKRISNSVARPPSTAPPPESANPLFVRLQQESTTGI
ncbi:hypothetical protein BASA81_012569 [Batrachochytrium salamandrivorans]|nr:hypothetical protein BASA81_012569 [Batrachochytrium salamandrivorans]